MLATIFRAPFAGISEVFDDKHPFKLKNKARKIGLLQSVHYLVL